MILLICQRTQILRRRTGFVEQRNMWNSDFVLADTSVMPPRKLCILILKKNVYRIKVSSKMLNNRMKSTVAMVCTRVKRSVSCFNINIFIFWIL